MKQLKKHHLLAFIFIGSVIFFIVGRQLKRRNENMIFSNGIKTVGWVYKFTVGSREGVVHRGQYFFYVNCKKIYSESVLRDNNINPSNKFFEVYYKKGLPNKSVVDYSKEVHPDSVDNYFPPNQNPFEMNCLTVN